MEFYKVRGLLLDDGNRIAIPQGTFNFFEGARSFRDHFFFVGSEDKVVLTAILCCVNESLDDLQIDESFTVLPLMLVKGPATLTRHLTMWLQVR